MTSEKLWSNIKWAITGILIPGISGLIWFVWFITQLSGDVNTIQKDQSALIGDFKEFKTDATGQLKDISKRVEAIENKQAIYQATHR